MIYNTLNKMKGVLPSSWFRDDTPVIDAVINSCVWCAELVAFSIDEAIKQLRLLTATGGFLDLISNDFFGSSLPRMVGEGDDVFVVRVIKSIFREKVTYSALYNAVNDIMAGSGAVVSVYEYGIVGTNTVAMEDAEDVLMEDGTTTINMEPGLQVIPVNAIPVGIDQLSPVVPTRYGTNLQRFEALVTITNTGGITGALKLEDNSTDLLMEDNVLTINNEHIDESQYQYIFNAILAVKPIGTTVWVSVT